MRLLEKQEAFLLSIIEELTIDQLNTIPEGFNNNTVWNFGHIIAAQQGVCYARGGVPMTIDEGLFQKYKPETKPVSRTEEAELNTLKELLYSTIDQLEADFAADKFGGYVSWKSRYGVEVNNIKDAITLLLFHDGLHVGYIMTLRRVVRK